MPTFGAGETVTLITTSITSQDLYGNNILTETSTDIPGCAVWPQDGNATSSNEKVDARDTVIIGFAVVFPVGTVVKATDRVQLRGDTFEVVGEPGLFHSPFTGSNIGPQVAVRRITG